MSTTKWIHFNWGDEGIQKLFNKVYNSLNDGGLFILEPQPWNTYKKKAGITPVRI
jgi:7SK snRNA methylphosphate capping enzyme